MSNPGHLARILKVLSVETRVRMVRLLKARVLCVGALAGRLDVTQGAVSQHLRILRDAGLVIAEKRGCFVHYRLDEKTLAMWRAAIDKLLTSSSAEGTRQKKGPGPCATMRRRNARSRRS